MTEPVKSKTVKKMAKAVNFTYFGNLSENNRQGERNKENLAIEMYGCDHTSTKAPDPIRTPQLSVLGRE